MLVYKVAIDRFHPQQVWLETVMKILISRSGANGKLYPC